MARKKTAHRWEAATLPPPIKSFKTGRPITGGRRSGKGKRKGKRKDKGPSGKPTHPAIRRIPFVEEKTALGTLIGSSKMGRPRELELLRLKSVADRFGSVVKDLSKAKLIEVRRPIGKKMKEGTVARVRRGTEDTLLFFPAFRTVTAKEYVGERYLGRKEVIEPPLYARHPKRPKYKLYEHLIESEPYAPKVTQRRVGHLAEQITMYGGKVKRFPEGTSFEVMHKEYSQELERARYGKVPWYKRGRPITPRTVRTLPPEKVESLVADRTGITLPIWYRDIAAVLSQRPPITERPVRRQRYRTRTSKLR